MFVKTISENSLNLSSVPNKALVRQKANVPMYIAVSELSRFIRVY